jgi:hypothetical protein
MLTNKAKSASLAPEAASRYLQKLLTSFCEVHTQANGVAGINKDEYRRLAVKVLVEAIAKYLAPVESALEPYMADFRRLKNLMIVGDNRYNSAVAAALAELKLFALEAWLIFDGDTYYRAVKAAMDASGGRESRPRSFALLDPSPIDANWMNVEDWLNRRSIEPDGQNLSPLIETEMDEARRRLTSASDQNQKHKAVNGKPEDNERNMQQLAEASGGALTAEILAIATNPNMTANRKMQSIKRLDNRYRKSTEWGPLLKVSDSAIRDCETWKAEQKRLKAGRD